MSDVPPCIDNKHADDVALYNNELFGLNMQDRPKPVT